MSRFLLFSIFLLLSLSAAAQTPLKTITEIVTPDGEGEKSAINGQTIRVQGVVLSDPNKWYQFPPNSWNNANNCSFWIQAKGQGGPKSGCQIRLQNGALAPALGLTNIVPGNFIELKGKVDFYQGEIQIALDTLAEIQVLEQNVPIAPEADITIKMLNVGSGTSGGTAQATGNDYQGAFVRIKNAEVVFRNSANNRGNFRVKDNEGNEIIIFDSNKDMRNQQNGYTKPEVGETISEISGIVYHRGYDPSSGAAGNFELHPFVVPQQIKRDSCSLPPQIGFINRTPVCPKASEPVKVTAQITHPSPNAQFVSVKLRYKTGAPAAQNTYTAVDMTNVGGSEWSASIPAQANGTFVHYFIEAQVKVVNGSCPANLIVSRSEPTYNPLSYTVNDNGCEIYDIQRTFDFSQFFAPSDRFSSGYEFQTITGVRGVVTSTADKNTNLGWVHIQQRDKNTWAGIQLYTQSGSLLADLNIGDSVIVSGTVKEYFGLTQIEVTDVQKLGTVSPITPLILSTNTFVTNNEIQTEATERYESMLIRVNESGLRVVNRMPDENFNSRKQHWRIGTQAQLPDNGLRVMTGGITASRCSKNIRYINSEEWMPYLINVNAPCYVNTTTTLSEITGVVTYDFYRAVLLPRNEADIVNLQGCSLTGITKVAENNQLFKLYPNPTANQVIISAPNSENFTATFLDLTGKVLLTGNSELSKAVISTESLVPGIYFVKLHDSKGNHFGTQKLVIAR